MVHKKLPNKESYRKLPYKERYPDIDDPRCSFYVFFLLNGRTERRSLYTRNDRIAQKKFVAFCEELDRGIVGFSFHPRRISFVDFAHEYLREGTAELAPVSVLRHRQNLFGIAKDKSSGKRLEQDGHLVKFFKRYDFKTIRVRDVERYILKRKNEGVSASTILKELATLSAMFSYAMRKEILNRNPVRSAKKPKQKITQPGRAPSMERVNKILQHCYPGARRFILAFLNSGCRKSELSNCDVSDADLDEKKLRVIRKGGKKRHIFMNTVLLRVISEELASRSNVKLDDPLFLNREGRRYRSLRTVLRTACKRAGVPLISHHDLRHAYATFLHQQGKDIPTISCLMGHANPTVTQNIYIHLFDDQLREAAESFEFDYSEKGAKKAQKHLRGIEPARSKGAQDFKSCASASSATPAQLFQ